MSEPTTSDSGACPKRRPLQSQPLRLLRSIARLAPCVALVAVSGCGSSPPALPEVGFKITSTNPSVFALGFGTEWQGARYRLNFDGTTYLPPPCTGTTEFTPDRAQVTINWTCTVDTARRSLLQSAQGTLTHDANGEYEGPLDVVLQAANPDRTMSYQLIVRIAPYVVAM